MRLKTETTGDFEGELREAALAGERATTATIRGATRGLKTRWRREIRAAQLGRRLAGSIQGKSYPRNGESWRAAGLVYSKAAEIVSAHDRGAVIRSREGFFLAIPTEAAGRGRGGKRMTPLDWERRRGMPLRYVYRRGRPSLLVADGRLSKRGYAVKSRSKTGRNRATVVVFVLVPQVRLRKRLDLMRSANREQADLPEKVMRNWNRYAD